MCLTKSLVMTVTHVNLEKVAMVLKMTPAPKRSILQSYFLWDGKSDKVTRYDGNACKYRKSHDDTQNDTSAKTINSGEHSSLHLSRASYKRINCVRLILSTDAGLSKPGRHDDRR